MREIDVAGHEGDRDRTTVVDPAQQPSLTTDGDSRDMSGDATTIQTTVTTTATTNTTATTTATTESGRDGGTDGTSSDGDGGDGGATTTYSGDGPHS